MKSAYSRSAQCSIRGHSVLISLRPVLPSINSTLNFRQNSHQSVTALFVGILPFLYIKPFSTSSHLQEASRARTSSDSSSACSNRRDSCCTSGTSHAATSRPVYPSRETHSGSQASAGVCIGLHICRRSPEGASLYGSIRRQLIISDKGRRQQRKLRVHAYHEPYCHAGKTLGVSHKTGPGT